MASRHFVLQRKDPIVLKRKPNNLMISYKKVFGDHRKEKLIFKTSCRTWLGKWQLGGEVKKIERLEETEESY